MWFSAYNRLIEILYADQVSDEDLTTAIAISDIVAARRESEFSELMIEECLAAIEVAVRTRIIGGIPPDDLKNHIRPLFLNQNEVGSDD